MISYIQTVLYINNTFNQSGINNNTTLQNKPLRVTMTLLLGTCDTKLPELLYTKTLLDDAILLDLGHTPTSHSSIDISQPDLQSYTKDRQNIPSLDKHDYIAHVLELATPVVKHLHDTGRIHAVLGLGGSSGTVLGTGIMRHALPVGFPKLMVSTMASGDIGPYVEETDITMMYSVVDIAGTNRILSRILGNAAAAVRGMANFARSRSQSQSQTEGDGTEWWNEESKKRKRKIGITMFGVTTPCVEHIRTLLEPESQPQPNHDYELYVFHATGAGGKAMDRLISEGQLDGILDLTTTEVADEVVGGVLSAGPGRMGAGARAGIPQVVSVGACDMVNFGTRDSVPAAFAERARLLYEHNPSVTLMRTTVEEVREIARFMAGKLREAARPECIRVLLPVGGVSMLDAPGQAFHDPKVDEVLFDTLEKELQGSGIDIRRDQSHINHPDFAAAMVDSLLGLLNSTR